MAKGFVFPARARFTATVSAISFAAAANLICAGSAFAQEAPADQAGEEEAIVVTGFRNSLSQALEVKRSSASMVDAIVAEDIAKFPDQNLAESLQRIPGVAIERQGGEGRRISVRGLGSQFTAVRLNGLQTIAAGADNATRSFDFNIFASELFNNLVVHKSYQASLDEGSLGAVVDLNTGNPLAGKAGFTAALNVQGAYNTNTEQVKPRVAALLSYRDPSGVWGANVSVAYSRTFSQEVGHDTGRWAQAAFDSVNGTPCFTAPNRGGTYIPSAACDEAALAFHPRIPRYVDDRRTRERLGITASFQLAPTDRTKLSIDGLYSKFDELQDFRTVEVLFRGNERPIDVVNYTVRDDASLLDGIPNRTMVSGTFNDAWVRSEHYQRDMNTEFYQISGKLDQEFSDSFRVHVLGGISKSTSNVPRETAMMFDDRDAQGFHFDYTDMRRPVISYGTSVTDPASFQLSELRDSLSNVENNFRTVSGAAEWDVAEGFKVSVGGFYRRYEFDRTAADRNTVVCPTVSAPTPDVVLGTITCTPSTVFGPTAVYGFPVTADMTEAYTLPGAANAAPGSTTQWLVADIDATAAYTGLYGITPRRNDGGTRGVIERTKGAFLQFDAKGQIFGLDYTLNAGVRYARTDQTSRGINSGTVVVIDRDYEDWLPAFNLSIWPAQDVVIRAAASEVITRPELGDLTPGGSVDGFNYRVSFGNPFLDPYRATSYDLSVEWYFRPQALLSLAYFRKDVASFPISQSTTGTYASTGLPLSLINPSSPAATNPEGAPWAITSIVNGTGAKIDGFEVAFQTPFWFLPGALSNFGILANATFVSSSANYGVQGPGTAINPNGSITLKNDAPPVGSQLFNLSKRSVNGTLYYEDSKLSARVSGAYRSPYTSGLSANGNVFEGTNESLYFDASISYKLTDFLTLSLEGINILNEKADRFADQASDRVLTLFGVGRTITAGVRLGF